MTLTKSPLTPPWSTPLPEAQLPPRDNRQAFDQALAKALPQIQRAYQRGLNRDLSRQQAEGVFERQTLSAATLLLETGQKLLRGESAPAPEHPSWQAWCARQIGLQLDALLAYTHKFNASSCAISNFAQEHRPDADYLNHVLEQLISTWQQWRQVNSIKTTSQDNEYPAS